MQPPRGQTIAGRYLVGRLIGRGSSGCVCQARDLASDTEVAVKFIEPTCWADVRRTSREIAALRALRLPGVVALLDEGSAEGWYYLVMELAEGRHFPGPEAPMRWDRLQPLVMRLLAIVARVHAAGFVHRDLKPQNVLVRPDGWVTLLDFGLARRPHAADTVTQPGNVAGTPEYLAPEVLEGAAATARSDVFALGAMVYEALAGVQPWTAHSTLELLQARAFSEPRPLRDYVDGLAPEVEAVLMRMLARDPRDRPSSAAEVMVALDGGQAGPGQELPRLGPGEPLARLLAIVDGGGAVDIGARPGWGATRLLKDAEARWLTEGREVVWLRRGGRPFESLLPVVGKLEDLRDLGLYEAWQWIRARLRERLATGLVVVQDDPERVDRWSMQALHDVRGDGRVVRAGPVRPGVDIALRPLTEEELRPLFSGPERILHIPSDAAAELWLRTGGIPGRIRVEVDAWVAAGLASWEGDRLHLMRDSLFKLGAGSGRDIAVRAPEVAYSVLSDDLEMLSAYIGLVRPAVGPEVLAAATGWSLWEVDALVERLEAQELVRRLPDGRVRDASGSAAAMRWGPERRSEACGQLAERMAPGTEGRLVCLLIAGELGQASEEARVVAARQAQAGRLGDAIATIEQALALARDGLDPERKRELIEDYADAVIGTESPRVMRRAVYEIERIKAPRDDLVTLLQAANLAFGGPPDEALAMLGLLPRFVRPELELRRQALRVQAASRVGRGAEDELARELADWVRTTDIAGAKGWHAGWLGGMKARRAQWDEAAMYQAEAVRGRRRPDAKCAALLAGAAALLETGRYDAAEARATEAHALAITCRHGVYEARAEAILRVLAYRRDGATMPDVALCEAVASLAAPDLEGAVRLNEAAIAWRGGQGIVAQRLAREAAQCFASVQSTLEECLARALAIAAGAEPVDLELLVRVGERAQLPLVGAQVLALVAEHADVGAAVLSHLLEVPREQGELRREVLSVREILNRIGRA